MLKLPEERRRWSESKGAPTVPYRKSYYFYFPQSFTVIKSKMAATTEYYEHEQGFAHAKYACTAGYVLSRVILEVWLFQNFFLCHMLMTIREQLG